MGIDEIFEGLSLKVENYEKRQSQIEMSKDIYNLMINGQIGLIEAPTGIGKSFSYLIASSLFVKNFKKKIVIATSTINLQKQLILKDIPVIKEIFKDVAFDIALGRQNYACKRKFYAYASSIFSNIEDPKAFLANLKHGTKDEFDFWQEGIFEQIKSEKDSCMGRFCPQYRNCFFFNARSRLKDADIIVTNHHLVFSDLFEIGEVFDAIDALIFDEAHNIEKNLTSFATLSFNFYDQLNLIRNFSSIIGKLRLFELINKAMQTMDKLKEELIKLANIVDYSTTYDERYAKDFLFRISDLQKQLVFDLVNYKDKIDVELGIDFKALVDKLSINLKIMESFLSQNYNEAVYWLDKFKDIVLFNITNLNFADLLKKNLYPKVDSVIFTSATLSINSDFSFIKGILGIEKAFEKTFKTEFDYKSQAKLIIVNNICNPQNDGYIDDISTLILTVASQINKGTLVLFTSYKTLNKAYSKTNDALKKLGYTVLKQGLIDNYNMQKVFFKSKTILFGVNSFWEGIDIKGDNLSCVIMTKLPFEVPTHPIEKAKYTNLEKKGQNAFINYSLQKAILKFKQGFGRLIRTKNDTGFIVIADNRVLTKPYGKIFLNSLPEVIIETKSVEDLSLNQDH
ncbi:DinG family ATP-dependent helicase YoaA [Desulfurella amilsii]|uniref:DinG family ATP-dependent helicase YoaA n=1 Tax=Desulfurella amilsii TaxID=1562698 RepID=A0A1X4XZM2_9BACT|nr:helicase C-terminal domain-containing protein [Desulfurella amilsii]OSS42999.1 DinG family ATP-dependent helicase YoaA [Desulfurella amilsii]